MARTWTFQDSATGGVGLADDGSTLERLRARTDGDEAVSAYRYSSKNEVVEFRVVETGDPNVIQPGRVTIIFGDAGNPTVELRSDIIQGLFGLERWVSSGRRDLALAQLHVQG